MVLPPLPTSDRKKSLNCRAPVAWLRSVGPVDRWGLACDRVHGLMEGHTEGGDKEVDGVAGPIGGGIPPVRVVDDDAGMLADAVVAAAGPAQLESVGVEQLRIGQTIPCW